MILGRTNVSYPLVWASLGVSSETTPEELVAAVRPLNIPLDISSQPALWGGFLRGGTDVLVQKGGTHYERATSQDHATDLVQAHLIEVLSSVGREMIDFYFLRIRRVVEEYQINGALAALEFAKQEGHIKHLCLLADGPSMAVQSVWQFHDAFEAVMIPQREGADYQSLHALAQDRRVGIVSELPRGGDLVGISERGCTLMSVQNLADVEKIKEVLTCS